MITYDILTQQNARETLQRLTGIAWSTWQCLNKNYNREQFLSDEDYVNSILDKEGCLLPAFRDLEFTFGHITTSSTACESIRNGGLTKLACTNMHVLIREQSLDCFFPIMVLILILNNIL